MRLIADIFTRAEVSGASHEPVVRAEGVGRTRGGRPGPTPPGSGDVVCVHFTGTAGDHSVWLAEGPAGSESPTDGTTVAWERTPRGVLRGHIRLGGVAADVLVVAPPGAANGRRLLRALGLSRAQSAALSRWAGRPTVATFSHGPAPSPETQRRIHRVLLASLSRWDRLRGIGAAA
jgi:hypothetical protein